MGINRRCASAFLIFSIFNVAHAATISAPVPRASVQDLLKAANPVVNENALGYVQAYDSPFQYQQRPYSVPVSQKITIPSSAIKDALKSTLKSNVASVAMHAAMAGAVAAAGWVINEAGQPVKKSGTVDVGGDPDKGNYYWTLTGPGFNARYQTAMSACQSNTTYGEYPVSNYTLEANGTGRYFCVGTFTKPNGEKGKVQNGTVVRFGDSCPTGSTYNNGRGSCVVTGTSALTDSDFDTLTNVIDKQSADFRARLATESCEGSLAPARCFQALQDASSYLNSGPSYVQGPTTSSTTTHKNPDGTSSISTTNTDTKFNAEYDKDSVTLKPEKTTKTTNPDGTTSETVDKEDDNSKPGQKPGSPEKKDDDPLEKQYTFTDPDLPKVPSFYEQKYPDGLQSVWNDNKARFESSAFIEFMKSFVPSFSGTCPTWGLSMNILPQASYGYMTFSNICYVFDFVKVVFLATAVFTARKIMFGG